MILCFSESSLDYEASHQGQYISVCGVNPSYWQEFINDKGYEVNSIKAGIEVYKFYLDKYKDKRTALLKFKGVDKNKKVKKIVDKIIIIERELK